MLSRTTIRSSLSFTLLFQSQANAFHVQYLPGAFDIIAFLFEMFEVPVDVNIANSKATFKNVVDANIPHLMKELNDRVLFLQYQQAAAASTTTASANVE